MLAVPAAWAFETIARLTLFADRARAIGDAFGPSLRRIAWVAFGLTLVFGAVSVVMRGALRRRYGPGGAMMAGASIPQVPGILACSVGLVGADPRPVAWTVLACTLFVAWHKPA